MKINGKYYQSVWRKDDSSDVVQILDQRYLPHEIVIEDLATSDQVSAAIVEMHLRGAPLIGIVAAFGVYFAYKEAKTEEEFKAKIDKLGSTRPTAINLNWAIERQSKLIDKSLEKNAILDKLYDEAFEILKEDVACCKKIGENGLAIIEEIASKKTGTVNILTHCNAGWLATGDYGTATSPIYHAFDKGLDIHVYVDETRPRNQGARLTAWELAQHGIPHTVIVDNVGGHLMQHGLVDVVITGADRVTRQGDAANKIGTYLKALAANDNNIPFYVALPFSTFDFSIKDGVKEIPIEERGADEVTHIRGKTKDGKIEFVQLTPNESPATNFGFDVTPARLVTKLITEKGICDATEEAITNLYPDQK